MANATAPVIQINEGNVGIGTDSPSTELSVNGAISAITSDYDQGTTGSRLLMHSAGTGNSHSYIQAQSSGGTSNAEDLALQLYGGNVGIGTASPSEKLQVVGNTLLNSIFFSTGYGAQFISTGNGSTINFGQPISYVQNMSVQGRIQASSSVMVGNNTITASAADVGGIRYRVSGNNSYMDMCMQTGNTTYAWVNIVQNQW